MNISYHAIISYRVIVSYHVSISCRVLVSYRVIISCRVIVSYRVSISFQIFTSLASDTSLTHRKISILLSAYSDAGGPAKNSGSEKGIVKMKTEQMNFRRYMAAALFSFCSVPAGLSDGRTKAPDKPRRGWLVPPMQSRFPKHKRGIRKEEANMEKAVRDELRKTGREFLEEERAVGVVELILILVVLISLVIIFKDQLTSLVTSILEKITSQSSSI